MLAAVGGAGVQSGAVVTKVVIPAVVAPVIGASWSRASRSSLIYRLVRPPPARARLPAGSAQARSLSGSLLALAHGTNDAQKTMGVIALALVAHGSISADHFRRPRVGGDRLGDRDRAGHLRGGWRIIRTVGTRIISMDPAQGFAARARARRSILVSTRTSAIPLSSTHVISGGVMGAGAAKRLSAVRWGVAGNIVDRLGR